MKTKLLKKEEYSLGGLLFLPADFKDAPLIIYLHGAGERGQNEEHLYKHGIPKLIREGREFPAIILSPQCPGDFVWNNVVRELKEMIDKVVEQFEVKPDRISITGSSMGGFGTFEMALTYTAFFVLCRDTKKAKSLLKILLYIINFTKINSKTWEIRS